MTLKQPFFMGRKENLVCKLNKSIYGLKQSARSWYQKINEILRTLGFLSSKVKSKLSEHIQLKDLGDATHYLGIQIEKDIDGNILLHQKLKILRILDKYGMSSSKGVSTPMEVGYLNIKENRPLPRVVKPNEHVWRALKIILGYLKSTSDLVLVFETSSSVELTAYTDVDWGNEKDRKSTTGYIYKLGTNLITWVSQKQNSVSIFRQKQNMWQQQQPLKK
ncbi:hypothetical protein LAZ67_10002376 [Cordylochernes scorpioides]|uniref:Reverse transcriptase Ty1/copia-type domain-containing protein n=1 Tax=Cordylochernes scorpioides TaxID=51811 RepID=A0ABY6KWK9_9ARAC|nr:hypothetical protein LAZ67_10002376 [Cordylochernes scorpioides]